MRFGKKTLYITPKVHKHFSEIRNDDLYRVFYSPQFFNCLAQDEAYPELTRSDIEKYAKMNEMRVKELSYNHYKYLPETN